MRRRFRFFLLGGVFNSTNLHVYTYRKHCKTLRQCNRLPPNTQYSTAQEMAYNKHITHIKLLNRIVYVGTFYYSMRWPKHLYYAFSNNILTTNTKSAVLPKCGIIDIGTDFMVNWSQRSIERFTRKLFGSLIPKDVSNADIIELFQKFCGPSPQIETIIIHNMVWSCFSLSG